MKIQNRNHGMNLHMLAKRKKARIIEQGTQIKFTLTKINKEVAENI